MSFPGAARHGGRKGRFILAATASCSCSTSNKQTRVATSIFWRGPRPFLNRKFTDFFWSALILWSGSSRHSSDCKHEYSRKNEAADHIPKTDIERSGPHRQIPHDQRSYEASKISDGVDQAD